MRCKPLTIKASLRNRNICVYRGRDFVTSFKTVQQAQTWKERQEIEDRACRLGKINAYLDERAARPGSAEEPSAQLEMF